MQIRYSHRYMYIILLKWDALIVVAAPSTEAEWRQISQEFVQRWNLPNCIDSKHEIVIQSHRQQISII